MCIIIQPARERLYEDMFESLNASVHSFVRSFVRSFFTDSLYYYFLISFYYYLSTWKPFSCCNYLIDGKHQNIFWLFMFHRPWHFVQFNNLLIFIFVHSCVCSFIYLAYPSAYIRIKRSDAFNVRFTFLSNLELELHINVPFKWLQAKTFQIYQLSFHTDMSSVIVI